MPIPMMNHKPVKPYNIVVDEGNNTASIDMYGEVVAKRPTNWWTGEPVKGNYIALDEFLNDLQELKGKSSVTIHINSVGGDFFAGLAIYNRLKALDASITTINDGLAASAGSIIFMAGDKGKRKVNAGSNLMVHGVMSFLYGYYNVSDLNTLIKELKSLDKTLVAAYKESTGLDEETIKTAISKDTYMTGQEAVDNGWADEVVGAEGAEAVNMALSPDKSCLMVNGHAVAACMFGNLPANIHQMSAEEWAELSTPANAGNPGGISNHPAPQVENNTQNNGGNEHMEIKNVEELTKAYPNLVAEVQNTARNEGIAAERNRIQEIEGIQNSIGDADMILDAKYGENPMNAKDLAFAALQKQAAIGITMVNNMAADNAASGVTNVTPTAAPSDEGANDAADEEAAINLIASNRPKIKKEV